MSPQEAGEQKPRHCDKIEPIVWLLFVGIFGSVLCMIVVSKISPNDGQTFQVLAGLASFFSGALGMRIKPAKSDGSVAPADKPTP